jgi:hypothetical protein
LANVRDRLAGLGVVRPKLPQSEIHGNEGELMPRAVVTDVGLVPMYWTEIPKPYPAAGLT